MIPPYSRVKKGFTLIELLVVIAIIAILAAILFPVFARARENARRSSCLSNTKQIGIGILQYVQDYDEKFPLVETTELAETVGWWGVMVQPYIKSKQVFFCPSDSSVSASQELTFRNVSYGYNYVYLSSATGVNIASMESPSETIVLTDKDIPTSGGTTVRYAISYDYAPYHPTARHFDGTNIAYADGHSKWQKLPGDIIGRALYWDLY